MTDKAKLQIDKKATTIAGTPIEIMQLAVTLNRQVAQTVAENTGKEGVDVLDKINLLSKAELLADGDAEKYVDELKKNGEDSEVLDKAIKDFKKFKDKKSGLEKIKGKADKAETKEEMIEVLKELVKYAKETLKG